MKSKILVCGIVVASAGLSMGCSENKPARPVPPETIPAQSPLLGREPISFGHEGPAAKQKLAPAPQGK